MIEFRAGLLPPHPEDTHPRLHLGMYLTGKLPAPPAAVDWYSRVAGWPMYGNDSESDCTIAMVGHIIEGASTYGEGSTVKVSDNDVLAAYEAVSGYNPADPSTDQGAVLQDVYGYYRSTGVGGHKTLAYAQVDVGNLDEVRQSVALFGAAGLGIVVSQDMMDDFNAGKPWTRATGQQLGGHAVPAVGYGPGGVLVVTWGQLQPMTWDCFKAAVEEGWVSVQPEWFSAAGVNPTGLDLHALGDDLAALTGGVNPFPPPQPAPAPPPAPAPNPTPDALHELAGLLKQWWTTVETWMKKHGLG